MPFDPPDRALDMILEFFRFLLVGISNTLVGLTVIYGAKGIFHVGDIFANAAGYLVGLSVSFVLNRSWTFRHEGTIAAAAIRFFLAFLIAYTINLTVVLGLIHGFSINSYFAQAMGIPPYTVTFFLLTKYGSSTFQVESKRFSR